jgi:hypothetical protein
MLPNINSTSATAMAGKNHLFPSAALLHMATGSWLSQAIYVAAKLGIADLLATGPVSSDTLASLTGSHAGTLYRI